MAIYRRGYERYEGELTGHIARLLVLPRFAARRILAQRLVTMLLVTAMFWPLASAIFVYFANRDDLLQSFGEPRLYEAMQAAVERKLYGAHYVASILERGVA